MNKPCNIRLSSIEVLRIINVELNTLWICQLIHKIIIYLNLSNFMANLNGFRTQLANYRDLSL